MRALATLRAGMAGGVARLARVALLVGLLVPTGAEAEPFSVLVPKRVQIAADQPSARIRVNGIATWGAVIATQRTIPAQSLRDSVATFAISNPEVTTQNNPGLASDFPTLALNHVGGTGTSTNQPHPLFAPLLQPGEQIAQDIIFAYGITFRYPEGTSGTATMDATLQIGNHFVRYETILEFDDRPSFAIDMVEAQRVIATPVVYRPNLDPNLFEVEWPELPDDAGECTAPKPEGTCSGVICKPCNTFICDGGEWVRLDMDWPDFMCRQRRLGATERKARPEKPTTCPRTAVGLCPPQCDLCF